MKSDANSFRQKGCVFVFIGLILSTASIAFLFSSFMTNSEASAAGFGFLFACASLLSRPFLHRGARLMKPLADEALSKDSRTPIIYLRQFKTDKDLTRVPIGKSPYSARAFTTTWEDEIAKAVTKLGPFIALGDPDKHVPMAGAARKFSSDEEWKETIQAYLSNAQLVIYRIGESDALEWELAEAIKLVSPMRFIIFIPPPMFGKFFRKWDYKKLERQYAVFREKLGKHIPCELPEKCGKSIFIWFDKNWESHLAGHAEAQRFMSGPGVVRQVLNSILMDTGLVNQDK